MISVLALSNDPICITIFLLLYNIYKIRKANQEHRLTGEPEEKFSPMVILHILKRLITNPLIIGIIIGFVYAACRFKACPFLDKAFTLLQSCVLALCLFCVGGFLSQHSLISCNWIHFIICALCRHIVFPILIGLYCLAFHVSNRLSRQCIIISCLPSASVSFILESEFDLSPGLASTMIFWTTILCIPFQMLWLFVMDKLNIFPDNT